VAEKFTAELLQKPGLVENSCEFYPLKVLPEKKDISIEQVRDWRRSLLLKSFDDTYKVGIIYEAEKLNQESANALLKIIEEPSPKTVIIVITVNKQQLLPTIVSRCQCLKFLPVAEKDLIDGLKNKFPELKKDDLLKIIKLSAGKPGLALKFLADKDFYQEHLDQIELVKKIAKAPINSKFKLIDNLLENKDNAQAKVNTSLNLIESLEILFRDNLLGGQIADNHKLLQNFNLINVARDQLRQNVQPKLVLENLFLNL